MTLLSLLGRWVACACLCMASWGMAQAAPASQASFSVSKPQEWVRVRGGADQVVITTAGDAYALDRSGHLWRLTQEAIKGRDWHAWQMQPALFSKIRATLDGTVWGMDADKVLYRFSGSVWRPVAQDVLDVSATPDGSVMLLLEGGRLASSDPSQVVSAPLSEVAPQQLLMDEHGLPWLLYPSGQGWRWNGQRWAEVARVQEGLRQMLVGLDGTVVALNDQGRLLVRRVSTGQWEPGASALERMGIQASTLAVGPQGRLWLVDRQGQLFAELSTPAEDPKAAVAPALFTRLLTWRLVGGQSLAVSLGADGSAFSLAQNGAVWQWKGEDQWHLVNGQFQALAAGVKGTAWGLDARQHVFVLNKGQWLELPGLARAIAAGPNNTVWAITPDDALVRWASNASRWERLGTVPPGAHTLAMGPGDVPWVILGQGDVQFYQGGRWIDVPGVEAASLGVGLDGTVYATHRQDQSIQWLDKRDMGWKPATGKALSIAVGPTGSPWIVAPGHRLMASGRFLREEAQQRLEAQQRAQEPPKPVLTITTAPLPTLQKSLNFQTLPSQDMTFQDIGIGSNGAVFALGGDGSLFCFSNASRRFMLASFSQAKRVAVNAAGQPWLLNTSGVVTHFDKTTWVTVPEFIGQDLAIGPDDQAWAVDTQGESYRYTSTSKRFERMTVASADAPVKARRIAGANGNIYWVVTQDNQLVRCDKGDCRVQLIGVSDVAVSPDNTVFALDLLGSVRRFNPSTKQYDKQNGTGVTIAVGPQGLPWLVTAEGRVGYAGLFNTSSRVVNTDTCAAQFSQAQAPVQPPNATLQVGHVNAVLVPGGSLSLLSAGTLNGRPVVAGDVSLVLNTLSPLLSVRDGVLTLASGTAAGTVLNASFNMCPLRTVGACATGKITLMASSNSSSQPPPVAAQTAPSAPLSVSASPGPTQAVVSFSAPANLGGSPVTSYIVTASPGGQTANGSASPITVTGLSNGTAYTFTVVAINAVGSSPASLPSAAVTPMPVLTVPGAPTAVVATAGLAQATISFGVPANSGGSVITGYTATSSPGGFTGIGTASPIVVTSPAGLSAATAYTFTVVALNAQGSSVVSPSSQAVTPLADVPGVPTAVTAVAGPLAGINSAVVSFIPPVYTGGLPISSYLVEATQGGVSQSGTGSPVLLTGLQSGIPLSFTVKASSSVLTSAASTASNTVTPANVPGAPTGASIAFNSAGGVEVSYAIPVDNGSAITSTTVTGISPTAFTLSVPGSVPAMPQSVGSYSGYPPGTTFQFSITATNAMGISAAVTVTAVSP